MLAGGDGEMARGSDDSQHKAGLEDGGKGHVREGLLQELAHPFPCLLLQTAVHFFSVNSQPQNGMQVINGKCQPLDVPHEDEQLPTTTAMSVKFPQNCRSDCMLRLMALLWTRPCHRIIQ